MARGAATTGAAGAATAGMSGSPPVIARDPFAREETLRWGEVDAAIREAGEVVFLPAHGVWATGRYATIRAILRDWGSFTSTGGTGLPNYRKGETWRRPSLLLDSDPPEHNRARAVMNAILSPGALAGFARMVEARAELHVGRLVRQGRFDAARDLAEAFLLEVFPDAVGLPRAGRENLLLYAAVNFNMLGPDNALRREALEAGREAIGWVEAMSRREALAPGGFGAAIWRFAETGEITGEEAALLVRTFLSAGLDTTIYAIGNAIRALAEHPRAWAALRGDPGLAEAVFEETLRWAPPSHLVGRTTARPVELGGQRIGAEEKILLFIAAGNRDPRQWEDPDRFDIRRRTRGHLAFGLGVHGCVGQVIARIEAVALLGALARSAAAIALDGPPELRPSNWLRGHARLPVRATPA